MAKKTVFDYLSIYKNLPTYQLERRLDAFMLPHISDALISKFENIGDDLELVYPEFPLKRNTNQIELDKHSEYADYLLYSKKCNTVYLVEFKTDIKSIHQSQFKSYLDNSTSGWESMLHYYIDKAIDNSKYWKKFVHGLIHIENVAADLLGENHNLKLDIYLENSKGIHERLRDLKLQIVFKKSPLVKFLYLAPKASEVILDGYKKDCKSCDDYYMGLITLADIGKNVNTELKDLLILIEKDSLKKI